MAILNFSSGIFLWLALTCGICFAKNKLTGNISVSLLIFFNNLNIFIAICEIQLHRHIDLIRREYQILQDKYGGGNEFEACVNLLSMSMTPRQLFDGRIWALMWSTYALFDPSYQNPESFGFFIDVGNGYTTILPCVIVNASILFPQAFSSLFVGCVAIASYWQMLYGTLVYFLSFLHNERQKKMDVLQFVLFVGITNMVWIIFPALGIWMAIHILNDGNFSVFDPRY